GVKRFTAPEVSDGRAFQIIDGADDVVFEGVVQNQIGDFSDFNPHASGPYRVLIETDEGDDVSLDFGIGANLTERISYETAIGFMTDARCFFGELAGKA